MADHNSKKPSLRDISITIWHVRMLNGDYQLYELLNEIRISEINILGVYETLFNQDMSH